MKRTNWGTAIVVFACLFSAACKSSGDQKKAVVTDGGRAGNGSDHGNAGSAANAAEGSEKGAAGGTASANAGAAAGGAASATDSPPSGPADCAELGAEACARLEECTPFLMKAYYENAANCRELFTAICAAAGESESAIDLEWCGASLASCGSFVEARGVPAACWKGRGKAALDASCEVDNDCAEGLCERAKDDPTGTCKTPASVGDSCAAPRRCATGLRCSAPDFTCVRPAEDGGHCASPFECQAGSKCTADQVCEPTEINDTCDAALLPCSLGQGQSCVLDACAELQWADTDNSCLKGNVECSGTERCVIRQLPNLDREGACRPAAGFGADCDAEAPCLEPLTCVAGSCKP